MEKIIRIPLIDSDGHIEIKEADPNASERDKRIVFALRNGRKHSALVTYDDLIEGLKELAE